MAMSGPPLCGSELTISASAVSGDGGSPHDTVALQLRDRSVSPAVGLSACSDTLAAKITPLMLDDISYGTFLLFGACCILMGIYTIFCVPETKNVPLESIRT